MRSVLRVIGLVETLALLGVAMALLATTVHANTWVFLPGEARAGIAPVSWRIAAGWPLVLAWATARWFALMPAWRWIEQPLALRFALVEAGAAAVFGPSLLASGTPGRVALALLAGVALVQGAFALFADERNELGSVLVDADAVGDHTTLLWAAQGLVAVGMGAWLVVRALGPRLGLAALPRVGEPGTLTWTALWGVLLAGLGLLSWLGAGPQKVLPGDAPHVSWQRFALLFSLAFGAAGLASIAGFALHGASASATAITLLPRVGGGLVGVGFALANAALLLRPNWIEQRIQWVRDHLQAIWLVQLAIFIALGLVWLLLAPEIAANLGEEHVVAFKVRVLHSLGVDAVVVLGAMVLGMAGATLLAIGRGDPDHRRFFARALAVWHVSWLGIVFYNMSGHAGAIPSRYTLAGVGGAVPVVLFAIPNLIASIAPVTGPSTVLQRGGADTRPPGLLVAWTVQGLLAAFCSVMLAFAPDVVAHTMISPHSPFNPPAVWEVDQLRIHASYFAFAAALTWQAMNQVSPWLWRPVARFFVMWSVLMLGSYALTFNFLVYAPNVLVGNFGMLVVLLVNLWLLRHEVAVEDLGVPREPLGLGDGDILAAAPMAVQTAAKRRRASHLYGVGAEGAFTVGAPPLHDPRFPHNDFFHQNRGRALPVTMRFANLSFEDDASLDVRGAALRIGAEDDPERFDLLFNTGSFSPPRNLVEFAKFVLSKWAPRFVSRVMILSDQVVFEGAVAGLRRAPESYAKLFFYGQIVRIWVGTLGPGLSPEKRMFLVRYRLAPVALLPEKHRDAPDRCPRGSYAEESGLPDETDTAAMWVRTRRPDERRPRDYLRRGFRDSLVQGTAVEFTLQAQFREVDEPAGRTGEALSWYNAGVDWDEDLCPWWDLGRVELTRALADEETERLRFNPGLCPSSMGTPASPGPWDYRSLGDAEVRVMKMVGALRSRILRWGGTP